MNYVYLLIRDEWEDIIVYLTEKEAIEASIKYSKNRVEIFAKNNGSGYEPTYSCYKDGKLYEYIGK